MIHAETVDSITVTWNRKQERLLRNVLMRIFGDSVRAVETILQSREQEMVRDFVFLRRRENSELKRIVPVLWQQ